MALTSTYNGQRSPSVCHNFWIHHLLGEPILFLILCFPPNLTKQCMRFSRLLLSSVRKWGKANDQPFFVLPKFIHSHLFVFISRWQDPDEKENFRVREKIVVRLHVQHGFTTHNVLQAQTQRGLPKTWKVNRSILSAFVLISKYVGRPWCSFPKTFFQPREDQHSGLY